MAFADWDLEETPKKPVVQVLDSSPSSEQSSSASAPKPTYNHTKLFGNVKPKPIHNENSETNSASNLREKFSFNGSNLMSQNNTNTGSVRDIEILQKLFPSINVNFIKAVYKSKGNKDLKLTKQHLTTVIEKRKQEEILKKANTPTPISVSEESPRSESSEPKHIEVSSSPVVSPQKAASSKVVLNKKQSIHQKYSTTYKKPAEDDVTIQEEAPAPKKRRLVRGSRNHTPISLDDDSNDENETKDDESSKKPTLASNIRAKIAMPKSISAPPRPPQQPTSKTKNKTVDLDDEEAEEEVLNDDFSDSDVEEEDSAVVTSSIDDYYNQKTLEFMNSAEDRDIVDVTQCTFEIAANIVKKRPFRSINQFEALNFRDEEVKRRNKTDGETVSTKANLVLRGYAAVDSLVKQCNKYSDTISNEIGKWGVKVHGVNDELEVVDVNIEDSDEEDDGFLKSKSKSKRNGYFKEKPKYLSDEVELKSYQQVGINWLNLLYKNKLSCILADEMGLGKTCQVIAFLSYLKQTGVNGPHLVVVPSSTLENWMREFRKFAPSFVVEPYYGSQLEREDMREVLTSRLDEIDVIVTTYNLATGNKDDASFLKYAGFNAIVYDEGHMLKNSASDRFQKLMKIRAKFRLLLTGTPLQNNLRELMSLLEFILPSIFVSKKEDLKYVFSQKARTYDNKPGYNPLLSERAISKAKKMMAPFILRRRKDQVLKHLPPKVNEIEKCEMVEAQKIVYQREIQRGIEMKQHKTKVSNILMGLRKAAIHPLLFRRLYTDDKIKQMSKEIMKESVYADANQQYIYEDMEVMTDFELTKLCENFSSIQKHQVKPEEYLNSGKVKQLGKILPEIIAKDGKILIFSLFTQVLDILERVLSEWSIKFLRLDGGTSVEIRQDIIDKFYEEKTIPVFLLSTKAGGFGINLVCANTVIIFDQSFNPHDDKQAEDRAHRVGQLNPVKVIRLISENSIEENMYQLALNKLELDKTMSGEQIESKAVSYIEQMIFEDKDDLKDKIKDGNHNNKEINDELKPKVEEIKSEDKDSNDTNGVKKEANSNEEVVEID
ncbi:hypothetical protein BN7_55 [Wickerhamomyces ciferrii]|uniref:DNA helicase n=1 Tax=Wickerhamomyces ciferrii (strain ATCC 14091 / BCRC 22168 / CBS 111 / JCM 3599 / NBRC 0793 / NRRL Y-1031 F-60-10) TaxID=1206466 RepID=K0KE53_WICCF|nr:uncharacterized protein BN7_55 [Wickerhamomyces ciferrii]CCH40522.1 hypothetical protein BN7_55 [Wickerhamomyces ciferrii]